MKTHLSLMCIIVVGVLFGLVSCERLTVTEQPTAVAGTATPGYPDIQAMIDGYLDEALAAADNAAARHAAPDPAYATLRSLLGRARDANLAPARALKLDRGSLAEATEEELKELEKLAEQDPALVAEIEALTAKLEAEYAAIPPIEVIGAASR